MPTSYHYDPLPPPVGVASFTAAEAGHAPHSPAPAPAHHWGGEHGPPPPPLHSMTSYYSHPAFLPHAARDLREAQAGMQVIDLETKNKGSQRFYTERAPTWGHYGTMALIGAFNH